MIGAKQNPFSLYDFLGYFTPGALFLYGVAGGFVYFQGGEAFKEAFSSLNMGKVEIYIPFVLIAYVLGHFLSFISAITIERYAIWAYGYPSRFLLNMHDGEYWVADHKMENLLRFCVGLILFPISVLDTVLGRWLYLRKTFSKPLDGVLSEIVKDKIVSVIKIEGERSGYNSTTLAQDHDFFRFVYHYVVENSPSHLPKMQNYVALYGFLRTLTFIFVFGAWGALVHVIHQIYQYFSGCEEVNIMWGALLLFMLVSYVGYMAFMKFYRRFTLEALMAVSVVFKKESNNGG